MLFDLFSTIALETKVSHAEQLFTDTAWVLTMKLGFEAFLTLPKV